MSRRRAAVVVLCRGGVVLLGALVGLASCCLAQAGRILPDCQVSAVLTAAGPSGGFDNRGSGCSLWRVVYTSTGFSAVQLQVEEAADSGGTSGTFVAWPGAPFPITATTSASAVVAGAYSWVRLNLTSASGTGTVIATLYGWRSWPETPAPTSLASQAALPFVSASVTAAVTIDGSPGNLFAYEATNTGSAGCYLEFFNSTSGGVTLGTTVPIWTVPLPATASNAYSRNNAPTTGALFSFSAALSAAAVTTAGGSTTCAANSIVLDVGYR